jgi:hypothetical protein
VQAMVCKTLASNQNRHLLINRMQSKTILVELSHPHSLRLLRELEQVNAIKLIKQDKTDDTLIVPEWQKEIVRKRVANSKDSDFTELDEAFKKLRLG